MAGTSGDRQLTQLNRPSLGGTREWQEDRNPQPEDRCTIRALSSAFEEHASAEYDYPEPRLPADPGTDGGDDLDEGPWNRGR